MTKHGHTCRDGEVQLTPEYQAWASMKHRCTNPNNKRWPRYGGRGIRVCEEWMSFENFFADMGPRPPGMSLDRIDNDGNYEPANCRWASVEDQNRNRSNVIHLTHEGETLCVAEWTRLGLGKNTIYARLQRGWSVEEALSP